MNAKVMIASSGGVDSTVACFLLKEKGYKCISATIKTWPKDECGKSGNKLCCSLDAIDSARGVAGKLSIPHYVFDFSLEFKERIRDYCTGEYEMGRTPNPCILCNSEIKFGLLLKKAKELGCDFIASGHYARISFNKIKKIYSIKKGLDKGKDQSYFLFNLTQDMLKHIIFPLGPLLKENVRRIAKKANLKSQDRKSSQDICFEIERKNGERGDVEFTDGGKIGMHNGISHYTLGQRRGLGIAYKEPLYVTRIDAVNNIISVGTKRDTLKKALSANNVNWISNATRAAFRAKAKIRYGSKEAACLVKPFGANEIEVIFDKPQASPAPGQAVVLYKGDAVLGGGWIKEVLQ